MSIVFAGTPEFAAAALSALHAAGYEVPLVLTQPDRPAGRGLRQLASAVKGLALELGLPLRQPPTLKDPRVIGELEALRPEAMVVAAYGLILPPSVLAIPRRGCINIHATLLPRWRGAAPIQRAILAGDSQTGISIMQMDEGLDTGPVLLSDAVPIEPDDTAQSLHGRLAALGARLIVRALAESRVAKPQDPALATYAGKIDKHEARIDWNEPAQVLSRKVRAFNPAPGAVTAHRGSALKVWHAMPGEGASAAPGTVVSTHAAALSVACGEGTVLRVTELQRAGGRRLSTAAFLAGSPIEPGERLGA